MSTRLSPILNKPQYGVDAHSFSVPNLSNADYHSIRDYVSSTGVRELVKSPAHYRAWCDSPATASTAAQRIGTALHAAVLEPEVFARDYVAYVSARRGRAWLEFCEGVVGKEILTPKEMAQVVGMRDALLKFDMIDLAGMIGEGGCEQSIFWTDPRSGEKCRIRCDLHHADAILDLKTTNDVRPSAFEKQARQNGYPIQGAFYRRGVEAFAGERKPFWLIAVETEAPYAVWIHEVGTKPFSDAESAIDLALGRLKRARLTKNWEGYTNPWTVME